MKTDIKYLRDTITPPMVCYTVSMDTKQTTIHPDDFAVDIMSEHNPATLPHTDAMMAEWIVTSYRDECGRRAHSKRMVAAFYAEVAMDTSRPMIVRMDALDFYVEKVQHAHTNEEVALYCDEWLDKLPF